MKSIKDWNLWVNSTPSHQCIFQAGSSLSSSSQDWVCVAHAHVYATPVKQASWRRLQVFSIGPLPCRGSVGSLLPRGMVSCQLVAHGVVTGAPPDDWREGTCSQLEEWSLHIHAHSSSTCSSTPPTAIYTALFH